MGQIAWNKGSGGCKRGHDPSYYKKMPNGPPVCIMCKRENAAKYRVNVKGNPEYIIRRRVERYGIDVDGYKALIEKQNGRCPICGKKITLKNSHIDHCHESGVVRGVLCISCNTGIGFFKDSIDVLGKAITYLERNREAGNSDKIAEAA